MAGVKQQNTIFGTNAWERDSHKNLAKKFCTTSSTFGLEKAFEIYVGIGISKNVTGMNGFELIDLFIK
jgi:hypothetical protein